MKTKKSRLIWIVLGIIIIAIGALSIMNCINSRTEVNYSEFYSLVSEADENSDGTLSKAEIENSQALEIAKKLKISNYTSAKILNVVFDSYVVEFDIKLINDLGTVATVGFTTNYSRQDAAHIQQMMTDMGISYTYTDPNAGSIWSSLLPLGGCVLIAIVFFIIMMQTQGGTKSAMNFAKTNARVNHN